MTGIHGCRCATVFVCSLKIRVLGVVASNVTCWCTRQRLFTRVTGRECHICWSSQPIPIHKDCVKATGQFDLGSLSVCARVCACVRTRKRSDNPLVQEHPFTFFKGVDDRCTSEVGYIRTVPMRTVIWYVTQCWDPCLSSISCQGNTQLQEIWYADDNTLLPYRSISQFLKQIN